MPYRARVDPERRITGDDVLAALRAPGGEAADAGALRRRVAPGDAFATYEELARACPPEAIGLSSGAHAAVFAPLFGEFE